MSKNKSTKYSNLNGRSPKPPSIGFSAPAVSTATAGCGDGEGNLASTQAPENAEHPFTTMLQRIGERKPTFGEITELVEYVFPRPDLWFALDFSEFARTGLIKKMAKGEGHARLSARVRIMEKQLSGENPSQLELLVIEQILITWLRLLMAQTIYNDRVVNASTTPEAGIYWDQYLSNAQRRHLSAIETLARIRRLGRISPTVQLNIAQNGSQQMNVQETLQ